MDNKVQIKSNQDTFTGLNISKIFDICYKMATDTNYGFIGLNDGDTHLTKNIEWGAVAYLAHSPYGRCGTRISIHDTIFLTSKISNVSKSTTNNISGVYDMCGGCWEYVAANFGYNKSFAGNSPIFDQIMSGKNIKYIDFYNSNTTVKGDAMEETRGWQNGCYGIMHSNFSFLLRGGYYGDSSRTVVFAMDADLGCGDCGCGFRPVICRD